MSYAQMRAPPIPQAAGQGPTAQGPTGGELGNAAMQDLMPRSAVGSAATAPLLAAIEAGDASAILAVPDFSGATPAQLVAMMNLLVDLSWSRAWEESRMLDLLSRDPAYILAALVSNGRLDDLFEHIDQADNQKRLRTLVESAGDPKVTSRLDESQRGFVERTREVVASAESSATEIALGYAGFNVGLLQGIGEGLKDAVMDVVELGKLLWTTVTGNLDLRGMWEALKNLNIAELLDGAAEKWNAPDVFDRWKYRGWVVSYTLSMVLVDGLSLLVTGGAALAAVAATKLARFGRLARVLESAFRPVVNAAQTAVKADPGALAKIDDAAHGAGEASGAARAAAEVPPDGGRQFLGSGSFADAYREGDMVTKEIKDQIGQEGTKTAVTPAMKARIGDITAEFVDDMRKGDDSLGKIIPPITHASPGKLSMPFVDGLELTSPKLSGEARERAGDQARGYVRKAKEAIGLGPMDSSGTLPDGWRVQVDDNPANFRCDADGNITGWIDPVAAWPP